MHSVMVTLLLALRRDVSSSMLPKPANLYKMWNNEGSKGFPQPHDQKLILVPAHLGAREDKVQGSHWALIALQRSMVHVT